MLGKMYEREACSAARALEVAGERWSLLILRNAAFARMTRFSQFQESLGIAPNILAARLEGFVNEGLMTVESGPSGSPEYRLTEKGMDFKPVLVALTDWGDRWSSPEGPPIVYGHPGCEGKVSAVLRCERCSREPAASEVVANRTAAMEPALKRRRGGGKTGRRGVRARR